MEKEKKVIKAFNLRVEHSLWLFMKKTAADQGISMTDLVVRRIVKYKKKLEDRLT